MGRRIFDRDFTVGLFLAGGLSGVAILTIRWLWDPPDGRADALWLYRAVLGGWTLLALVPAALRALGARWAWRATDLCIYPLFFWFPVGTGLFVWWQLGPRGTEKSRLDQAH